MDGLVIRWTEESKGEQPLEISASKNGVMIQGFSECYNNREQKDRVIELLDIAYTEHEAIKDADIQPDYRASAVG